ncbi:tsukushi [Phymastichus coffea]|uniref:tsukushi n=1 Tax=Phymastichus coffea TaxID=108790 RepID=UPI00273B2566|nr:tsukushi [Phymastichus coffea]
MMLIGMNLLALLTFLQLASGMLVMDSEIPLKKCRYFEDRKYNLNQVLCKDLKLLDIPDNLRSNVEVLDARENRIRELRNNSLKRYSNLRFLYLADNFVQTIPEGAFESTYYLEVLDLSKNGLTDLPKSLFRMNNLRNLYFEENQLHDPVFEVTGVTAPLKWLYLSGNKLTQIPRLSPIPLVTILNVSHNQITRVTTEDIAPLCLLEYLDLRDNPIQFDQKTCECYTFKEWIKFRKINLNMTVDCPKNLQKKCAFGQHVKPEMRFSNRTMTLFSSCQAILKTRAEAMKARTTWIWIASCVGAFIGCIFIALCCMHRNNRNKRRHLKEQNILTANNANTTEQLLNKETKHETA